MISKFTKGKVYVFIDGANTFYAQQTLGWRIAYAKFIQYLRKECGDETKCFIYLAYDENRQKEQKFLDMLDINGYILRTKAIKKIRISKSKNKTKGSLDIELAFEMVDLVDKYDTLILVSGDSDFSVAVDRIKNKNKRIIVISTRGHISKELLDRAKYVDLRKLKQIISQ